MHQQQLHQGQRRRGRVVGRDEHPLQPGGGSAVGEHSQQVGEDALGQARQEIPEDQCGRRGDEDLAVEQQTQQP